MTDIQEIKDYFQEASEGIPFDNSWFQTLNFVVKGQYTPARAYRAILLRLSDRIQALDEAQYAAEKTAIDLEELQDKIARANADSSASPYDLRRWELDRARHSSQRSLTEKLVLDTTQEVARLYKLLRMFPKYTREQFEAEEQRHFEVSLSRQANGLVGCLDSLSLISDHSDAGIPEDLRQIVSAASANLLEIEA